MDKKYKFVCVCVFSPVGCAAVLLHSVVWILLCSQPHHHPAGQIITGKQHHHCGQVRYVCVLCLSVDAGIVGSTVCLSVKNTLSLTIQP